MKLMRAICDCGFHTQNARSGYHFHKWWFPVFVRPTGELIDVCRCLPADQVNQIQLSKVQSREFHIPFAESVTRELIAQYASRDEEELNPGIGESFYCPVCSKSNLRIVPVHVTAICKSDCAHEYQWRDSEQHGCPRCSHRPHRFRVDSEPAFPTQGRAISWCPCSSSTDSASYADAYCPKCGELPNKYHVDGLSFCGMHHTKLNPYEMPSNYLFVEAAACRVSRHFPNAKLWGDSDAVDSISSMFCRQCESVHQSWLAEELAD